MRFLLKSTIVMIVVVFIAISLSAFAETSQFSLLAEENALPLGGISKDNAPEKLDNVPYERIPNTLRGSFKRMDEYCLHLLGVSGTGEPKMTWDDVERLTFTGPYYYLGRMNYDLTEDLTVFRQSLRSEGVLGYLIRLDNQPAGVLKVTYDDEIDLYSFYSLSDYPEAELMAKALDRVSGSERYTDEVLFLRIKSETFIVNSKDMVISFTGMDDPATFTDLVKAEYAVALEIKDYVEKNNMNSPVGGGSVAEYLNNNRSPRTGDSTNLWVWLIGVFAPVSVFVGYCAFRVYVKHRQMS